MIPDSDGVSGPVEAFDFVSGLVVVFDAASVLAFPEEGLKFALKDGSMRIRMNS